MKNDLHRTSRMTLGIARAWKAYIRMLVSALLMRQARLSVMLEIPPPGKT